MSFNTDGRSPSSKVFVESLRLRFDDELDMSRRERRYDEDASDQQMLDQIGYEPFTVAGSVRLLDG
jgi:hypothetical protein